MMKRVLICLFIFLSVELSAGNGISLIRQAEAYDEAKEYDNARNLFEKLLGEKLEPWQRARLIYNIGTLELKKENWKEAGLEFNEIPYSPQNAPMLGRALKTNIAVMQYREAMQLSQKDTLVLEDYSKIFFLFREALKNAREAQHAECLLEERMGLEDCRKADDLEELYSALKKELAFITKRYGEAKIAESSVKEGVPYLITGLNLAEEHLEFLQNKNLDASLKKKYLKLFTRDVESWRSLWEIQVEKQSELDAAYQEYLKGLNHMKYGNFTDSRLAFLSSEALLSNLMHTMWGVDPFSELLRKLLTTYQRALDQVPIQIPLLYQIQIEQLKVRETTELPQISLEKFVVASNYLKQSIDYARQAKSVLVRFYLEEARQWLRRLLRTEPTIAEAPEQTLRNAIEEQAHALSLVRLSTEIDQTEEMIGSVMQQSQESTTTTAEPFLAQVLEKEIEEFPERCQCLPWNKVVPLFDKGKQAADIAKELMKQKDKTLFAMAQQEEALRYWREALDKLLHPEEDEKKPPEEEQPEEKQPEPEPEKTDIKEVLQLLQSMHQQDRRPEPEGMPPKEGARPW